MTTFSSPLMMNTGDASYHPHLIPGHRACLGSWTKHQDRDANRPVWPFFSSLLSRWRRWQCIDNVHFNDFVHSSISDASSVTHPHSVRNDPRLFNDDIDIRFSRTLNSCKVSSPYENSRRPHSLRTCTQRAGKIKVG